MAKNSIHHISAEKWVRCTYLKFSSPQYSSKKVDVGKRKYIGIVYVVLACYGKSGVRYWKLIVEFETSMIYKYI